MNKIKTLSMNKQQIIQILLEIAAILEIQQENPYRVRAYRNAARSLETTSKTIEHLIEEKKLCSLPGIGQDLEEKITTLHLKGDLPFYKELKKKLPEGLLDLLHLEGLGPKKVQVLYKKGITSIKELKKACESGEIAKISGFGEKIQQTLLESQKDLEKYQGQFLYYEAIQIAEEILLLLKKQKEIEKADIAGSLRRKKEVVKDIDLVAASNHPKKVMQWFRNLTINKRTLVSGETKSSILTHQQIQVDLRIVSPAEYGYVLLHSTGSKEHNIALRTLAKEQKKKLNEWGLITQKNTPALTKKAPSEEDIYQALGLSFIPPEIRENTQEIVAAKAHKLPNLICEKDIQGLFHVHTKESDGKNSLEEMAIGAKKLGFTYLGIADHSQSSMQANGLNESRVLKQIEQIQKWNQEKKGIHLFSGIECDILKDGSLDFPDSLLKKLDFVIVSIHRGFKGDEETLTKRLIKAIENPYSTMVGHVTGRLLLKRKPYAVNLEKVIDAAIANKKIIEINGQPQRLDMDWRYWHAASRKGLITSINPDAHSVEGLKFFATGINIARKGWLEKQHVFNSRSLKEIQSYLKKN